MSEIFLSIIIPTRNNKVMLSRCLQALGAAHPPKSAVEVLIVDNSDPGQISQTSDFGWVGALTVRVIPTKPEGLMAARHLGAFAARGEVLSFIDDDTLVNPLWLTALEECFRGRETVLAGGPIKPVVDEAMPVWVEGMWRACAEGTYLSQLSLMDFGLRERLIDPEWIWGCNYCVRRSAFMDLKGTLPDYMPNQLMLLCGIGESGLSVKIRHSGIKAWYTPALQVGHCLARNRLRKEYFITREFILGIEQAYTETRRWAGLGPGQGVPSSVPRSLIKRVASGAKRMLKHSFTRATASPWDAGDTLLKTRMSLAFMKGMEMHRQAAGQFPFFMEWVVHPDYFDDRGKLPIAGDAIALQQAYRENLATLLILEETS